MRWFKVRVDGLPPSARLWTRELGRWTPADQHTALAVELVHAHYRAFLHANGVKKAKLPPPLHIGRPWDKPKQKRSWIHEWATKVRGR